MTMGKRIAEARKKKGYTQEYVALTLGVSRQAVYKWEKDQSRPDTTNLMALAELLDVTVDHLISGGKMQQKNHESLLLRLNGYCCFISLALYTAGIFTLVLDEMVSIPINSRGDRIGIPFLIYGDSIAAVLLLFVVILLLVIGVILGILSSKLSDS